MITAAIIIGFIASLITILSFLHQHREKIVMIEPLITRIEDTIAPFKPTIRLGWRVGLEVLYIGCIAIGVIFFLQYNFGLISFNEAALPAALFLMLGLYMKNVFRNLY